MQLGVLCLPGVPAPCWMRRQQQQSPKAKKNPFHSMELAKHAPGGVQKTSCLEDLLEDAQKTSACPGAPLGGCRGFGGRQRAAAGSWGRRHPRDGGSAPRLGAGCSSAHRASSQLREDESTCPTNDQKASCLRVL